MGAIAAHPMIRPNERKGELQLFRSSKAGVDESMIGSVQMTKEEEDAALADDIKADAERMFAYLDSPEGKKETHIRTLLSQQRDEIDKAWLAENFSGGGTTLTKKKKSGKGWKPW